MTDKAARFSALQQQAAQITSAEQSRYHDESTAQNLLYDQLLARYNHSKDVVNDSTAEASNVLAELQSHWDQTDHTKPTGARIYQLLKNTIPGAHTAISTVSKGISALQDLKAGKEAAIQKHLVKPLLAHLPDNPGYKFSGDLLPHLLNPSKLLNDKATQRKLASKLTGPLLDKIAPTTKDSIQKVIASDMPAVTARDEIYKHAISQITGHHIPADVDFNSEMLQKGFNLDDNGLTNLLANTASKKLGLDGTHVQLAQKLISGDVHADDLTKIAQQQFPELNPEDAQALSQEALRRIQNPAEALTGQTEDLKQRLSSINHPVAGPIAKNLLDPTFDPKAAVADILTAHTQGPQAALLKAALGVQDPTVREQALTHVKRMIGMTALRAAGLPPALYDKFNADQIDQHIKSAKGILQDLQTNPEATKQKLANGAVALAKKNYEITQPHLYNAVRNVANQNYADAAENVIDHVISKQSPQLKKVADVAKPVIQEIYDHLQNPDTPQTTLKDKVKGFIKKVPTALKQTATDFTSEASSDLAQQIKKRQQTVPSHDSANDLSLADLAQAAVTPHMQSLFADYGSRVNRVTTANIGTAATQRLADDVPGSTAQEADNNIRVAAAIRIHDLDNPHGHLLIPVRPPGSADPSEISAEISDRPSNLVKSVSSSIKSAGSNFKTGAQATLSNFKTSLKSAGDSLTEKFQRQVVDRLRTPRRTVLSDRAFHEDALNTLTGGAEAESHFGDTNEDVVPHHAAQLLSAVGASSQVPAHMQVELKNFAQGVAQFHDRQAALEGEQDAHSAIEINARTFEDKDNPQNARDIESMASLRRNVNLNIRSYYNEDHDLDELPDNPLYSHHHLYLGHVIDSRLSSLPQRPPSDEARNSSGLRTAAQHVMMSEDAVNPPMSERQIALARNTNFPNPNPTLFPPGTGPEFRARKETSEAAAPPAAAAAPAQTAPVFVNEGGGEEYQTTAHPTETTEGGALAQISHPLQDNFAEGNHEEDIIPQPPKVPGTSISSVVQNAAVSVVPGLNDAAHYIHAKVQYHTKVEAQEKAKSDAAAKTKAEADAKANSGETPSNNPKPPGSQRRFPERTDEPSAAAEEPPVNNYPDFATPAPPAPPSDFAPEDDFESGPLNPFSENYIDFEPDENPTSLSAEQNPFRPGTDNAAGENAPATTNPADNQRGANNDDITAEATDPNATVPVQTSGSTSVPTPQASDTAPKRTGAENADEEVGDDAGDLGAVDSGVKEGENVIKDVANTTEDVADLSDPFTAIIGLAQLGAGGYQLYEGLKGGPPAPPPPMEALLQAPLPVSAGDPVTEQNNASNTFLGASANNL